MMITDVNEDEITEGARVASIAGDTEGWTGTVEGFDRMGMVNVEWDERPGEIYTHYPVRLELVAE